MESKPPLAARGRTGTCVEPDPILCFVETDELELRPRLLVDRLLHVRTLLQANTVLAPRFQLGDCAAAHHIVLGSAANAVLAVDRLWFYGFAVEPSADPPGIRFFVSSSHTEAELRALLVAITMVVRELTRTSPAEPSSSARR
jgi:hypothetical protein